MWQVTSLVAEAREPVPTLHFSSSGTASFIRLGDLERCTEVALNRLPDGDLIVWLRGFAAALNMHAEMVDGRRLADLAAQQREQVAYDEDLAALRLKLSGECS